MRNSNAAKILVISAIWLTTCFMLWQETLAQELILRGSVFCKPNNRFELRRPISNENIIIYPFGAEQYATMTTDDGVFNLTLPYKKFTDKLVVLVCYSDTLAGTLKLFTSFDRIRRMRRGKRVLELSDAPIILSQQCEKLSTNVRSASRYLADIKNSKPYGFLPTQSKLMLDSLLKKNLRLYKTYKTAAQVSFVSTIFIPFLPDAIKDTPPPSADSTASSDLNIISIRHPRINLGNVPSFLFNRRLGGESIFAPVRTFEQAVLWNPSLIVFTDFPRMGSVADVGSFGQFFITVPVFERFGIGFSFFFFGQNQKTVALLESGDRLDKKIESHPQLSVFSLAYKLKESVAIGLAVKGVYKSVFLPNKATETRFFNFDQSSQQTLLVGREIDFKNEETDIEDADFDLSATFEPSPSSRIGLSLMNLEGKKLLMEDGSIKNLRTLGIGASFIKSRTVFGFDAIIPQQDEADFALGLNYRLTNQSAFTLRGTKRVKGIRAGLSWEYRNVQTKCSFNYDALLKASFHLGFNFKWGFNFRL